MAFEFILLKMKATEFIKLIFKFEEETFPITFGNIYHIFSCIVFLDGYIIGWSANYAKRIERILRGVPCLTIENGDLVEFKCLLEPDREDDERVHINDVEAVCPNLTTPRGDDDPEELNHVYLSDLNVCNEQAVREDPCISAILLLMIIHAFAKSSGQRGIRLTPHEAAIVHETADENDENMQTD